MAAIGEMQCLACSRTIIVKPTGAAGLNVSCPHCDFSGYAKSGTEAVKKLEPKVKRYATEKPDAAPAPTVGESKKADSKFGKYGV